MSDFGVNDFLTKSLEFQQGMLKNWMNAMQGAVPGMGAEANPADPLSTTMKAYQDMYTNWQNQLMNNPLMKMYPWSYNMFNTLNTPFDIVNKMMNSGKVFTDLFKVWQEISGKDFASREEIQKFLDENQGVYNKVWEDFMLPFVPEVARPLMSQAQSLVKQFQELGQDMVRPWMEATSGKEFAKFMQGDTSAYMSIYKSLNKAYEETFGKILSASGLGVTKEQNEAIMSQFDSYFKMMLALTELMSLVGDVSKDNMISLIEICQEQIKAGKDPKSMREFYNLWLKINEDSFVKVFGTPQFSQIFGEFSKRACEFKIHCDQVMERALSNLPIPTNADMVSLYKTVYNLRKSDFFNTEDIQTLKADVAALKAELAAKGGIKPTK